MYIIHGAYVLALATTDAFVGIDGELLIVHHLAVEVFTNDIRVESGRRTFVEFLDATPAFLDHIDDV